MGQPRAWNLPFVGTPSTLLGLFRFARVQHGTQAAELVAKAAVVIEVEREHRHRVPPASYDGQPVQFCLVLQCTVTNPCDRYTPAAVEW